MILGTRRDLRFWALLALSLSLALLAGRFVEGHAVLKETSPAANSTIAGPDVSIQLKFNSRIDPSRSKLQLLLPDNTTAPLAVDKKASPDTLVSKATGLKPGAYKIQWQVLAPDGHITRGEIPFTVKGS
jgi:methionine-rich copper-binding protein CopC